MAIDKDDLTLALSGRRDMSQAELEAVLLDLLAWVRECGGFAGFQTVLQAREPKYRAARRAQGVAEDMIDNEIMKVRKGYQLLTMAFTDLRAA